MNKINQNYCQACVPRKRHMWSKMIIFGLLLTPFAASSYIGSKGPKSTHQIKLRLSKFPYKHGIKPKINVLTEAFCQFLFATNCQCKRSASITFLWKPNQKLILQSGLLLSPENGICNGGFQHDEGSFDMVDETMENKKKKKKERQSSIDQVWISPNKTVSKKLYCFTFGNKGLHLYETV